MATFVLHLQVLIKNQEMIVLECLFHLNILSYVENILLNMIYFFVIF